MRSQFTNRGWQFVASKGDKKKISKLVHIDLSKRRGWVYPLLWDEVGDVALEGFPGVARRPSPGSVPAPNPMLDTAPSKPLIFERLAVAIALQAKAPSRAMMQNDDETIAYEPGSLCRVPTHFFHRDSGPPTFFP